MDNRYKYFIKNTGILTISNFSSKILIFLLTPVYTSILTTEEYGFYDLISSSVQLVIPFLTLNIIDGVLRFAMDSDISKKEVISIGLLYILISVIAFAVLLKINEITSFWDSLSDYHYIIFVYFVSSVLNQLSTQLAKAMERVKDLAIAGILGTISTIVFNILFLLVIPLHLKGFYIAYTLGQLIPAIYIFIRIKIYRYITFQINRKLQKNMLSYSIPLMATTLGWWINGVSDRYVITWICGLDVNGLYSIAYKIPSIMVVFQNLFTQAWTISAIKEFGQDSSNEFYLKMFTYLNGIICMLCSTLLAFSKYIASFLYAKDFYTAWQYTPFLLISCVFNAASGFLGPILSAARNAKAMASSAICGTIVNLILNFILIYFIGPQGAAIATAFSSYVIYICRKRSLGDLLKSKKYTLIMLSWSILILQSVLLLCVKNLFIQLFCIVFIFLLYKDTILVFVNPLRAFIKKKK